VETSSLAGRLRMRLSDIYLCGTRALGNSPRKYLCKLTHPLSKHAPYASTWEALEG